MADPETLAALKRAYADTILNTTKEAAARVIVSEKKARRFQQELVTVRDEAIHTLLRLKHMFDSKVKETEMISLKQQQKVEELEAQLGEAEDIVGELRMELRELRDELKKVTSGQTHFKSDHEEDSCLKYSDAAASVVREVSSFEERSGAISSCIPLEQSGLLMPNGIRKTSLTRINSITRCSSKDQCDHTLPSILTKRREAEGCPRMIHAVDRIVASGDLSSSVEVEDVNNGVSLHEVSSCKSVEALEMSGCADASDFISSVKDKEDPIVSQNCSQKDLDTLVSLKTSPREDENDRKLLIGETEAMKEEKESCNNFEVLSYKSVEDLEMSGCADASDSVSSVKDKEDPIVSRNSSQKDLDTPVSLKTCPREDENDRKLAIGETEAMKEEKESCDNIEVSGSSLCEETPVSAVNKNRCIIYTFKRKRKKEVVSNSEEDSSIEENGNKKQKTGEKDDGYLESLKPSFSNESSQDNLRVAQAARQIVPFEEKKDFAAEVVNQ